MKNVITTTTTATFCTTFVVLPCVRTFVPGRNKLVRFRSATKQKQQEQQRGRT